jgi:glycerol uptake facilitator-like aquaporin
MGLFNWIVVGTTANLIKRIIPRDRPSRYFAEFVATFGLVGTILGCVRFKPEAVPMAVALYITSAYWFTSSTSFANPAVTIARSITDTFAGIAPASVAGFVIAQLVGAVTARMVFDWLLDERHSQETARAERAAAQA